MACPFSPERGQHLAREDRGASRSQLRRNAPAGIQLGHDSVQPELVTQRSQTVDHAAGRAEGHLPREDVLVREAGHALGLESAPVGGAGARPADGGPGQLRLASEEGREALARFLPRALLGGGGVDGDPQMAAGLSGGAGLAPGLPVRRELRLQIGDLGGAQPDEDGQPHAAGRGKRLVAGGGHAQRRMRDLVGTGRDDRVLDPIELTLVAEGLALPARPDDLQRFAKARLALAVGHAIDVVGPHDAAAADPELEAALADVIDGRHLFGDAQRMVQGKHLHGRPHPQPAGAGRDGARHLKRRGDHRARRREVDLAEPDAVDPQRVGPLGQLEDVAEGRGLARPLTHLLDEEPEVHGVHCNLCGNGLRRRGMSLSIRQIHPEIVFAGEVSGIDISRPLSGEDVAAVEAGMARYAVLVFHDQKITDEQQMAFSRNFGALEDARGGNITRPEDKRLQVGMNDVSNLGKDGRPLERDSRVRLFNLGNMLWHSDSSFRPIPAKYSLLSARVVNPVGGNTEFADMRAAYDALAAETKALIEDLVCEHSLMYSRGSLGMLEYSEEERAMFRPVRQRLVRTHPVTGRKSLYLSSHAGGIVGMPMPEARVLLKDLTEHATQPRFVYEHTWRPWDFVMWDNRQMMHRVRRYDERQPRDMRCTTVAGDAPTAAQV